MTRMRPLVAGTILLCIAGTGSAMGSGPDVSRKAQAYELYQKAEMLLLQRMDKAAADLMERAVERDPEPELLLETARVQAALGNLDRASALIDRALAARPGWAQALIERGDVALARVQSGEDARPHVTEALGAYQAAIDADPALVDATRAYAELSAQVGRVDEAIASLEHLATHRTLPPPMNLLLAKLYLRASRPDDARPILEGLVRGGRSTDEAVDLLAGVYEGEGRYDDAIALYQPLVEEEDARPSVYQRLGLLNLEAGHFKEAVSALETADHASPSDPDVLLLLLQAYDGNDQVDEAVSTCNRLLALEPDNLEAQFHHARLLRRSGDPAGARRAFEDLLLRAAEGGTPDQRTSTIITMAWAQVGVLALGQRDWRAAENALGEAVSRAHDPRPDVLRLLVRAHIEAGSFDDAKQVAEDATARFPEDIDLAVLGGEIRLAQQDTEGAAAFFHDLIERQSGSVEVYISVANAYMRRRLFDDAEKLLREAIRRRGEDDQLLFARGAALERLGRTHEAERALARAVEVNPKNAMALNYLGFMLADSGRRLNESVAYVERALAIEPDNPAYLDSLGWALFKLARYEPAEENLRAALRYDGSDPDIREHLGDLLIVTGRVEEAVREWQAALDCGHEDPEKVRDKMEKAKGLIKDQR
jgi:tetratricopeptide (TPR) repeat protein